MTIPIFEADRIDGPSRKEWARRAAALAEECAGQRELIVELEFEIVRLKEELALARALKI